MSEIDPNDSDHNLEAMSEIGIAMFPPIILSRLNHHSGHSNRGSDRKNWNESSEPSTASAAAEAPKTAPAQMSSILDIAAATAPTPRLGNHVDTKGKGTGQGQGKGKEVDRAYHPRPTDENIKQTQTGPFPAIRPEMGHRADNHTIKQIQRGGELPLPRVGRQTDYCAMAKAKEIDNWLNADNNHHCPSLISCAPMPINSDELSVSVFSSPHPLCQKKV